MCKHHSYNYYNPTSGDALAAASGKEPPTVVPGASAGLACAFNKHPKTKYKVVGYQTIPPQKWLRAENCCQLAPTH